MVMPLGQGRHQILALSGGGFRGVFTAKFLSLCEEKWAGRTREKFDLIAGTSIGALLAAGLAAGRSASELVEAMRTGGPEVFARRRFHGFRRFFGAPYTTEALRRVVTKVLGDAADTPMNKFDGKLIIPVVNYSTGNAEVFHTAGVQLEGASDLSLREVVLASAAPPTYFPMVKMGAHEYADGGLVANAPDMAALVTAIRLQRVPLSRCYMLSLGTASWKDGVVLRDAPDAPGILRSMWTRKLVQTIMSAQESLALSHTKGLLMDRHHRVDREPDAERVNAIRSLDNPSPDAFGSLTYLAMEAFKAEEPERNSPLREFFVH